MALELLNDFINEFGFEQKEISNHPPCEDSKWYYQLRECLKAERHSLSYGYTIKKKQGPNVTFVLSVQKTTANKTNKGSFNTLTNSKGSRICFFGVQEGYCLAQLTIIQSGEYIPDETQSSYIEVYTPQSGTRFISQETK